jgi:hypothetical protein
MQNVLTLSRGLDIRFWTIGLGVRRFRVETLELKIGTQEVRNSDLEIWKSGLLKWISGSPDFSDGYLGLENGSPERRSPNENPVLFSRMSNRKELRMSQTE